MSVDNKPVLSIPQDFEGEQAVLGAVFLENDILGEISGILSPNSFHAEPHRHIFRAMTELHEIKKPIDEVTLGDQLKAFGKLESVGGYGYLAELVESTPSSGNVVYYAKIIQEHALLRDLINTTNDVGRKARDPQQNLADLLQESSDKILEIQKEATSKNYTRVRDSMLGVFKKLEETSSNKSEITGTPTGFMDLDKITAGLQPADLVILAARPSAGKTALALNIASYVATRGESKGAVLVFSMEMSTEQLIIRMLSSEAKIDSKVLRTGNLGQTDWDDLAAAADVLSMANIFINDTAALKMSEIMAISRKLDNEFEHGVSMVVVDYIQLMKGSKPGMSAERETSECSGGLKQLAKDLKIPVIALSQLNRALEARTDKRPQLSDLRHSGSLEQDGDIIMFIYRDEMYNPDSEKKGLAELIIAKHRNGPCGMVELIFVGKHTKFANLARHPDSNNRD